jgi:two-component system, sensor histidine kinase and response regulator
MNAHVTKPIDLRQLFTALRRWIRPRAGLGVSPAPSTQSSATGVATLPADLPGIDIAGGLGRVGGNVRAYRDLLGRFTKSFADAGEQAERLLAAGDTDAAGRIVHSLKGVAGNLGARRLHDAAAVAEAAIRHGADADRSAALHALRMPLQEVIDGLAQLNPVHTLPGAAAGEVTADGIARLPLELRQEFRAAVTRADLQNMLALADRVAALDAGLAQGLRALIDDFAYDRLLSVMRE